ncbi:HAD family hydrolase [Hoylesella marshii]|uniref:HAD hydrolase, family IA, variant 3 n=1 Tax=Hoylesella marshii DSM 16973 = JCM 13450 TaxID=862515 RepID=E0NSF2_9BACT|nr:HAD family phosphatase [Hoylesella marshii]EFM01904.1 HAD hydrolase, family IA, variant 3 [Hoylesella marshii DSM 16973 = JCM 13450]
MSRKRIQAALFDLDGVVFDSEPQYTEFWGREFRHYYPEQPGLEEQIKGQTLVQLFDRYFAGMEAVQAEITQRLDDFERQMRFDYIRGLPAFVASLREHGVRTAVVTSSNRAKMENVYRCRPDMRPMFDAILTAEDFAESKPHPDCYLKAAARIGAEVAGCVVFEDSFNGLRAGRAAGMYVVGLATTNSEADIAQLSDCVVKDFAQLDYNTLCDIMNRTLT